VCGMGWVNDVIRHRQPSCVHSRPDSWPQQPWAQAMQTYSGTEIDSNCKQPINAPQEPHRVYYGPLWLDRVDNRPSVKADLFICNSFVTVSGQCMSVAIIISNKTCLSMSIIYYNATREVSDLMIHVICWRTQWRIPRRFSNSSLSNRKPDITTEYKNPQMAFATMVK